MKHLIFCWLALLLIGCEASQTTDIETQQDDVTVTKPAKAVYPYTFSKDHFGKIKAGMTADDVSQLYGGEHFVFDTLYGPEGITYPGYRLFKELAAEAMLTFPDEAEADSMKIAVEIDQAGSPWRELSTGIGIGTTLAELVRLNGKPITFYGFGWDYGGLISDFNGGKLTDQFNLSLDLDYQSIVEEQALHLLGDHELSSNDPYLEGAGVFVRSIRLEL